MTKYPEDHGAHFAELKNELADTVAMVQMLCRSMGIEYEEINELGLRRLMEFVSRRMVHDR